MGELRKFRRCHPLAASVITAILLVIAGMALVWGLGTSDPLLSDALYGISSLTGFAIWNEGVRVPSAMMQFTALVFVVAVALCIVVARMFSAEWGKRADIQITFHAPCGESFSGRTYQLVGLMCLKNVGNEDFCMLDWHIETEWGALHRSADIKRYQLLTAQVEHYAEKALLVVDQIVGLKVRATHASLFIVLLEQEMPSSDTVSPLRKLLILEGQTQQIKYQLELAPYLRAIHLKRDSAS